jgi:hypothetical protein
MSRWTAIDIGLGLAVVIVVVAVGLSEGQVSSSPGVSGGNSAGGSIASGTTGQPAVFLTPNSIGSEPNYFYADTYAGATVDVKVNACLVAAEAVAGICDARALGGDQTVAAQINVGNANQDKVTLLLPRQGHWLGTMNDGTSAVIFQYSETSIIGMNPGGSTDFYIGASSTSSLGYIYTTDPTDPNSTPGVAKYLWASGFAIFNSASAGHATATNIGARFMAMQDNTVWDSIYVFDGKDTTAAVVDSVCCAATFRNFTVNSNYTVGATPLAIRQNVSSVGIDIMNFFGLSATHPGANKPVIALSDSGSGVVVNIFGLYVETGQTNSSTCMINIDSGVHSLSVTGAYFFSRVNGATFPGICNNGAYATTITASGLNFGQGGNTWALPATAVIDAVASPNITALTDAIGDFSVYAGKSSSLTTSVTPATFSAAGAVSTPGLQVTGAPFTGGSGTTTLPQFYVSGAGGAPTGWNTSGTVLGVNGPAAGTSDLIAAFNNGGSVAQFKVSSGGSVTQNGSLFFNTTGLRLSMNSDVSLGRGAAGLWNMGTGAAASQAGFTKSAMTVSTAADVTCGTGGTISSCTAATTIPGLTFTLPLLATNWGMDCDLVVGQATAPTANQWLIQTATNGVTSTTASYIMGTAATAMAVGAVTDQASTTTAFQIAPSWTLGGTATKMPVHIHAFFTGVSVSGTVINLQVIAPTVADLLTIYEGSKCALTP